MHQRQLSNVTDEEVQILSRIEYEQCLSELMQNYCMNCVNYQEDKSLEEMADILEVLYAICNVRGYTIDQLEAKRTEKNAKRGGGEKRLFLEYVDEQQLDSSGDVNCGYIY